MSVNLRMNSGTLEKNFETARFDMLNLNVFIQAQYCYNQTTSKN